MKSSGFNVEDTHLTYLDRIERLFAIMIIAFTWAIWLEYTSTCSCSHKKLKYGRKAKSIFKYGLEEIANCLLNPCHKAQFNIFEILSCT